MRQRGKEERGSGEREHNYCRYDSLRRKWEKEDRAKRQRQQNAILQKVDIVSVCVCESERER